MTSNIFALNDHHPKKKYGKH